MDPKITILLIQARDLVEDALGYKLLDLNTARTLADVLERTVIELQGGHAAYCDNEDCPCRVRGREEQR